MSKSIQLYQHGKVKFDDLKPQLKSSLTALIQKVKTKAPSMKPRGVAFVIESIANVDYQSEETFRTLEKVVFSKLDDFIPHYLVKILDSYYQVGYGSGELYDKIINSIVKSIHDTSIKYSDILKFFEIYPEVTYIYENSMSEEMYTLFTQKIQGVIKDKKFPTEDVCRVFNILVRISSY